MTLSWDYSSIAMPLDCWSKMVISTFRTLPVAAPSAFNLPMGPPLAPHPEDLVAAETRCRALDLGPLLDRMPGRLWQMIGETGWQRSHGERSRLYIARALLQRATVLILDESFAALAPATLHRVQQCVLAHAPTLLGIAHP
jgi:ATP-binding cassette, subfamily B, bacterial